MRKDELIRLAKETVEIGKSRFFSTNGGFSYCFDAPTTKVIGVDDDVPLLTPVEVTDETTLQAAARFVSAPQFAFTPKGPSRVGVLNFASAKNPGGGFLRGTSAQEESIARSSSLYSSLTDPQCEEFYQSHKTSGDLLYSDRMIFTKDCFVFRDDDGNFLRNAYYVDVLTAAAPNLRAIKEKLGVGREWAQQKRLAEEAIRRRAGKILRVFADQRCDVLVLGAWGCGVFGNDPDVVAEAFSTALTSNGLSGYFRAICFAIAGGGENLERFSAAFRRRL